ncbi:MAG: GntR family transcriptional regulator [Clostridiales bacterium]|nr:GntR family transcriptional regulator [Candidatus Hydrogenedentota bacterium]NLF35164.1 GntR family transcriptional regulator [Clostridiales bacterium]
MDTPPQPILTLPPISPAAARPLYEQIVDGVKREISAGRLPPHTLLPSFRALAGDLLVSLITVKRAYAELEAEGIVYRRQGLGTFVSEEGPARSRAVKHLNAEALLRQALREGMEAGLGPRELLAMARNILQEEEDAK